MSVERSISMYITASAQLLSNAWRKAYPRPFRSRRSAPARLAEGYGLGWRIQRLGESGWYGSAVPAGAFGHAGATGTVAWADPASGVTFVALTNGLLEDEGVTLQSCGNIAAAALCGPA